MPEGDEERELELPVSPSSPLCWPDEEAREANSSESLDALLTGHLDSRGPAVILCGGRGVARRCVSEGFLSGAPKKKSIHSSPFQEGEDSCSSLECGAG